MAEPLTSPLTPPRAVLFDVDGTLAVGSSAHLEALVRVARTELSLDVSMEVVDERPRLGEQDITGWIDAQVWRLLLEEAERWPATDHLLPLLAAYALEYRLMLDTGTPVGTAAPGAGEVLERLGAVGIPVALVTGNAHEIAQLKLERLGLATPFLFTRDGGFGDWRESRADLPVAAVTQLGLEPGPDVWLVGDTVADMDGARRSGLTPIGVLTGGDEAADLRAAGATVVLASVADLLPMV